MNLRDRLRAVNGRAESGKKAAAEQAPARPLECWEQDVLRPLTEVPGAFDLRRETLMLMQSEELPLPLDPRRILYLDTETTGLSGGAGTVAFLTGLGWLGEDGFTVRQLVMRDYPEEGPMLRRIREIAGNFDVICTFNGRTFDLPLLKSRFLMNRMSPECLEKPHIDLLPLARRLWKMRLKQCNLGRLEEAILGQPRQNDLPGSQVPERYFSYLKTGQFDLLREVLRHNEQDIVSLCVLLNAMCRRYEQPEQMTFGADLLSMGTALEKEKHPGEAQRCYRLVPSGKFHAAGQLRLAESHRRVGDRQAAARVWQEMVLRHEGGIAPMIGLAKYYEHTLRDFPGALDMTERAIRLWTEPGLGEKDPRIMPALQHRRERLMRKLEQVKEKKPWDSEAR